MRRGLLLLSTTLAILFSGAQAVASSGDYDGTYQGSIAYTANVPDYGTTSGSAPLTFTVSGGSLSGSFTVPVYGTIAFSGSVSSSGSATATATYGCVLSMLFALSGSSANVTGSVSGCSDQGGTAGGTITATRTSAPPPGSASAPPPPPPPPPSNVSQVTGTAYVTHADGSRVQIQGGEVVGAGDIIETSPNAQVTITRGGSTQKICQNSIFQIGTGADSLVKRGCASFNNGPRAQGLAGFGQDCPFLSNQLRQICGDCPFISALGRNVLCGMASPVDSRFLAGRDRRDSRAARFTIQTSDTSARVTVTRGAVAVTSSGKKVVVRKGFATVVVRGHPPGKPRRVR